MCRPLFHRGSDGRIEMHARNDEFICRHALQKTFAGGCRCRRIAVKGDGHVRVFNLNMWEMDNIAPDEKGIFLVPYNVAAVPGVCPGSATACIPGRISSCLNGTSFCS